MSKRARAYLVPFTKFWALTVFCFVSLAIHAFFGYLRYLCSTQIHALPVCLECVGGRRKSNIAIQEYGMNVVQKYVPSGSEACEIVMSGRNNGRAHADRAWSRLGAGPLSGFYRD
ncbi:hypothetical protein F5Y17DRAFT_392463 [Xylariaceae sp. FL0594]|nr:hypothetical protein F5Y17DRAFT_392463 [Xylariaceae sp. FL0594]